MKVIMFIFCFYKSVDLLLLHLKKSSSYFFNDTNLLVNGSFKSITWLLFFVMASLIP